MLLLASCSKEKYPMVDSYSGFATAKINDEVVNLKPSIKYFPDEKVYGMVLDRYVDDIVRAEISIGYFLNIDTLQVLHAYNEKMKFPQATYVTRIEDGDVAGNSYDLIENDNIKDYIQLISYDEKTGKVVGKFQGSFTVDTTHIFDPNSPNDIVITDGYFETTIFQ